MPRKALSADEIASFREDLCRVATRRFAELGFEGVTMRALASELGCSPMTPYRYFADKAEIFQEVRAAAFARFGEAQVTAAAAEADHLQRLRALGHAYRDFALAEPAAYRIMFEMDHIAADPEGEDPVSKQGGSAWAPLHESVQAAIEAGVIAGDAQTLAHLYWSGLHGLVSLHLAGQLQLGRDLDSLLDSMLQTLFAGTRPGSLSASDQLASD